MNWFVSAYILITGYEVLLPEQSIYPTRWFSGYKLGKRFTT
jgi:hypothetical protein